MDLEEATLYIKKYEPVMSSVIQSMYYRVMGQSSIHAPLENILKFVEAEVEYGRFGGELERDKWPIWFLPLKSIGGMAISGNLWRNVNISEHDCPEEERLTTNIYVWGLHKLRDDAVIFKGENVVFTREHWWGMYMFRAKLENGFGLPKYSLSLFRQR